jgi:hypothetical protein
MSIPMHMQNLHVFPENVRFVQCSHLELPQTGRDKKWLQPDSLVNNFLMSTGIVKIAPLLFIIYFSVLSVFSLPVLLCFVQCCVTRAVGTVTFCRSGTETVINYGPYRNRKVRTVTVKDSYSSATLVL